MAHSECPRLGAGSVDFNALHRAAVKGSDLDKAVAAATVRVEQPAEAPAPAIVNHAAPDAPAGA